MAVYTSSQIAELKPLSPFKRKKLDEKTEDAYDAKLMKWFSVTNSFQKAIRLTSISDSIFHASNLDLCPHV